MATPPQNLYASVRDWSSIFYNPPQITASDMAVMAEFMAQWRSSTRSGTTSGTITWDSVPYPPPIPPAPPRRRDRPEPPTDMPEYPPGKGIHQPLW